MADSPNTPTLPKIHSRRAALAGIAGTLALATGALGAVALQSTAQHNPDAELIALCAQWHREYALLDECYERSSEAEEIAIERRPPVPPELQEPLEFADGPHEPSSTYRGAVAYWHPETLANYANGGKSFSDTVVKKDEVERHLILRELPVPEVTQSRCRELLAIHERWQEEVEAIDAEYHALDVLQDEQLDRCEEVLAAIVEHEPQTPAGYAAVANVLLHSSMVDARSDEVNELRRMVFTGVVRFGGGSVS